MYSYLIYQPKRRWPQRDKALIFCSLLTQYFYKSEILLKGVIQVEIRILHSTFLFYLCGRFSGKLTIIFSGTPIDWYLDTNGKVKEKLVQSTHVNVNPLRNGSLSVDQLPLLLGRHFGQDYPFLSVIIFLLKIKSQWFVTRLDFIRFCLISTSPFPNSIFPITV